MELTLVMCVEQWKKNQQKNCGSSTRMSFMASPSQEGTLRET